MALNIDEDFRLQLERPYKTLAWCWKITRSDSTVLRFTSYDRPLTIDGVYEPGTGFEPSAAKFSQELSTGTQGLTGLIDSSSITVEDIEKGFYKGARVELFIVNPLNLPVTLLEDPAKHIPIFKGIIGNMRLSDSVYNFEVRGIEDLLNNVIGDNTSKTCRVENFGDDFCKVNKSLYTFTGQVTGVDTTQTKRLFNVDISQEPAFFDYGTAEFTSGSNTGKTYQIAEYLNSGTPSVRLYSRTYSSISVGDNVTLITGCSRTKFNCIRYNNVHNFRGEPDVPTIDNIFYNKIDR